MNSETFSADTFSSVWNQMVDLLTTSHASCRHKLMIKIVNLIEGHGMITLFNGDSGYTEIFLHSCLMETVENTIANTLQEKGENFFETITFDNLYSNLVLNFNSILPYERVRLNLMRDDDKLSLPFWVRSKAKHFRLYAEDNYEEILSILSIHPTLSYEVNDTFREYLSNRNIEESHS